MKKLMMLAVMLAVSACTGGPTKGGVPIIGVDTLIRVDTTRMTDTVSITKTIQDTIRFPVHDTVVTRIVSHDTVAKMVTVVDSIPIHDTLRVTVAFHDTTFVPKYDTVKVVDATALSNEVAQYTLLNGKYLALMNAPRIIDTLFRTVHDTVKVPVITHDTVVKTVIQTVHDTVFVNNSPFPNCVLAEEVFLQGGDDSLVYVPPLGDSTRAAMWKAQHITGADQSYGPTVQVCMSSDMFSKRKKVLSSSFGPGLAMVQIDSTHQLVAQGLPGPSTTTRLLLFAGDSLIQSVHGTQGHVLTWANGLDSLLLGRGDTTDLHGVSFYLSPAVPEVSFWAQYLPVFGAPGNFYTFAASEVNGPIFQTTITSSVLQQLISALTTPTGTQK